MSQVAIRGIITTALRAWANTKGVNLVVEGEAFTPPPDYSTFIQLTIIPSDTQLVSVNGLRKRYRGDVFINIWAEDGQGTGESETLADEIANVLFPVVPKLYFPLSIESVPSIKKALTDDSGFRIVPVVFSYRMES